MINETTKTNRKGIIWPDSDLGANILAKDSILERSGVLSAVEPFPELS